MRNNTTTTIDGSDGGVEVFFFLFFFFCFLRIGGVEVEWRKNEVEIWDL